MMGEIGELLGLPQIISKWGLWQRNKGLGNVVGYWEKVVEEVVGGRGSGWWGVL